MQLGRQRWKIRGRIKSDDAQSWEEEHMVFLPYIHHNFEIKVRICLINGNLGLGQGGAGTRSTRAEDQQPLYEACILSAVGFISPLR